MDCSLFLINEMITILMSIYLLILRFAFFKLTRFRIKADVTFIPPLAIGLLHGHALIMPFIAYFP
jgi:hypothetical protein